jgi:hypothetical protein
MVAKSPLLGIMAVAVLIGSVVAPTLLLQQQASAVVVIGGKDFKKLTKQFQRDVLSLMSTPPPEGDRQLAQLFSDYEQATFRIFGLTPP